MRLEKAKWVWLMHLQRHEITQPFHPMIHHQKQVMLPSASSSSSWSSPPTEQSKSHLHQHDRHSHYNIKVLSSSSFAFLSSETRQEGTLVCSEVVKLVLYHIYLHLFSLTHLSTHHHDHIRMQCSTALKVSVLSTSISISTRQP